MKYSELSPEWQREAVRMEVNLYRQMEIEISSENEIDPCEITEDSEVVQEALQVTDYGFEKDVYTGKDKLIRVYEDY